MKPRQHLRHLAATLGLIFSIICVLPVAAQTSAGITLSRTSLSLTEAGGPRNSATVTVVLNTQPTGTVTVSLRSPDRNQVYVSPTSMTFTPGNWNKPKRATIIIVEDRTDHGSRPTMNVDFVPRGGGYNSQHSTSLRVQYSDNDTAGVTLSKSAVTVTEASGAGHTATYTVKLNTQPTGNVTVTPTSSDTSVATVSKALTFTTANWRIARTITVTGVDDSTVADRSTTITHAAAGGGYNAVVIPSVSVTLTDDDTAGVTLSKSAVTVTEATGAGRSATYTVKLNTQPSGNVTVTPTSGDSGVARVSPASLTFTSSDWNTAQQVTVTGVDDSIDKDRSTIINHAASGGGYNSVSITSVAVTLTDDDTAGVTVTETDGSTATTETGGADTINVVLDTEPGAKVAIAVSSSDTTEGKVDKSSLVFTAANWDTVQTVTVTGQDDSLADGDQLYNIVLDEAVSSDGNYSTIDPADVSVTNTDDDAGVTLSKTSVTVTEASAERTTTYTVVLDAQPSGTVTVTPTSGDTSVARVSPASLTFTSSNWDTVQTVTVTGIDDSTVADRSTTITHAASGGGYNSVSIASVAVTLTDDDTSFTFSTSSLSLAEGGIGGRPNTGSYTVKLNGAPTSDVTVTVRNNLPDEITVLPASLTFTTSDWNTPQQVTVTVLDNQVDNGDQRTILVWHLPSGGGYGSQQNTNITVRYNDNDTAGVTVTETGGSTATTEAGGTDTINVVLNTEPLEGVRIAVSSSDISEGTVDKSSLVFTAANWDTVQTVTVTGVDDNLADGDKSYNIVLAAAVSTDTNYHGKDPADVSVTNTDDDAGVTLSKTSVTVTEASGGSNTNTYTVVLDAQPSGTVTVTPTSGDTSVARVSPASLTFNTTNWSTAQTITVTGINDSTVADRSTTITHEAAGGGYNSVSIASVAVTLTDDDTSFTFSTSSLSLAEGGIGGRPSTGSYTVKLNGAPTSDVTVSTLNNFPAELTISPASLTFTTSDWNTPQQVTVTVLDNQVDNGDQRTILVWHLPSGGGYGSQQNTNITVRYNDNDTAGVTVTETGGSTATTEAGGTDTINVVLDTEPLEGVRIAVSSSDITEGTVAPSSLTFTSSNWDTAQTVTVTGVDDNLVDGDRPYNIVLAAAVSRDSLYSRKDPPDVSVTNTDDDAGVTLSKTAVTVTEASGPGRTATYTVVLDAQPSGTVTVTLTSGDTDVAYASSASLTFTSSNWDTVQTVTVTGVDDSTDADRSTTITHTISGGGYGSVSIPNVSVTLTDDDTAGVTLSKSAVTVTEASGNSNTDTYTVRLNTRPSGNVTVTLTSGDTDVATVSPASLTFTTATWPAAQSITVTGVDDSTSADRSTTITHAAAGGGYDSVVIRSVSVTLTDDDNSAPTGSVTISGTVTQGQTLTADTSTIVDPDGPSNLVFSYQWKRDGSDISSATGSTYTLTQADVGAAISVTVSWTDAGSIVETLTSAATANVANLNDSPTGSVTITGTVTQGQTLTADTSTIVDPDGPSNLVFSYQWKRDGSDISSATSRTYVLTQADVGKAISVIVSWTDAGSTAETLTSVATASVTNANDPPTGSVTITGTVTQGQTLTADTSTIVDPDGPASLTFTYQWKRDGTAISSATSRTYVLTQADVGKAISVIVSWTDAGSTAETLTSDATANVTNANDPPTGSVTITGTVTQGQILTAVTSTIVDPDGPSNLVFSYQWRRDGSAISSATGSTYILTQADVGKAITVTVSWTDAGSTAETLTSTATANVANLNDSPTGSVTITGTPTQGLTLIANTSGISDPDGPSSLTFSYQWKRDGSDISGATGNTHVLTQADVGKAISVTVSWTDAGSIVETLTSAATANVANLNDSPTGSVTITGTPTQGLTLIANTSGISDPDGPASLTFSYQWKRDSTAISSATQASYTLTQADVGAAISVTVSWTDDGGTAETLTSAATASVTNINDPPTGSVTITGTPTQGLTLIANTSGISDPDGPASLTFSYQWKRDSTAISSATQASYTLTQADVGKAISVTVSWTDGGGAAETLTSTATASVTNANDPPTGAVTITGTPTQGQTLTAVTSTIVDPDGPASLTFTYQWKRDSTAINSATQASYTLTQADVGKAISVTVSWTDSGGAAETLTSTATASVTDANDPPTGAVTITGAATQGQTLTAVTSTIVDPDGPSSLTFTYQWKRGVTVISGGSTHVLTTDISSATGRTYTLTQADVGAVISVTVSWTDAGSTAETLTSAATANVLDINDLPTGSVTITGTASQGQTLIAATSSISDPDGPVNLIFIYQWKRDSTAISGATSSTYVLKQADVGATITVTVSWTDAGGATESLTSAATSTVTATTSAVTAPAAPVGLKVIARSGKVKFRWTVPNNLAITHYEYKQWTGNTEPAGGWKDFSGAMTAITESRVVRRLTDGTQYNFRIRAVATGNVTGAPSDVITVTPGPTPTAPGDRPVVTAVAPVPGDRQITLNWGNPNNADIIKYQIRRRGVPIAHVGTKPDWNGWSDIPGSDKDTISHVVTGLPTGVKYYFRIRAVAGDYAHGPAAHGPASSVIGVKLVAAPSAAPAAPPGPTSLTAVADSGQVTLTWDHPKNPAITSYQYKYWTGSPESGRWTDMPGSNADTTNSPPVTGLTNGTKYHFRIRAMIGRVAGVKSRSASATPATPPVQKASTQISAHARYRQVELIWRDPTLTDQRDTTISKYQIKYWSGNSETGDWSDISATINTTNAYYLVTGLTNNTTYSFRIRGLTNGFITTESNLVQATPLAGPPRTPSRPQAVAGDSEVTLTWDNPNNRDITRYQILQWTGGGERGSWGDWSDIPGSDKDTISYTVPALTNGVKYSFRIRAVAGSVTGSQSPYTAVVIPKVTAASRRGIRSVTMGGFTVIGADPGSLGVDGDKINARVIGTGIRLALPSDHRVTRAAFSRPTPEQLPPPQAGVSFGAEAAYVDVDIDTPLPSASKATVCLQRPAGMPDHAAVYHLADQSSEWEQLTSTGNQPGYICGRTQSFSPIVVGTRVLGFTAASIDDHIWTLGAALGELQLPEATNGDSTITYRLHPRLPAGVNFDAATRRIQGTPTQVHDTTAYTYTATDTDGDTATLQFTITVEAAALQQRARALDVVLSALGRTTATDAVDIISNRFTATAAARPEVTLGGTALTSAFDADAVARVKDTLTATDRQHWYARDTKPQLLRSAKQLLTQSNFAIPLTTTDGDTPAGWTLWGRAAASGFSSNRLDTDGELYSGYIGLERRFGKQHNALAGIAITHSDGDADYRVAGNFLRTDGSRGAIEGEVDLEMTSILPYIHYTPRAGTGIWGMAGIGRGEVELRDEVGKIETDVDLLMAAVGGRQLLSRWHGIDFALKSDAFAVQLKSDRKLRLAEVTGVARRARVALEMSSERLLSEDAVLRPSIEFGGRWDDGDADTGVGAEIGGGLEYRASGFSIAARGRYSFAHRQSGFEDWGGSLALTIGDAGMQGHGQGLWLSLTPEWGNPTSGVQQTWNGASMAGVEDAVSGADADTAAGRLKLEFGYGMQTRGRGWQVMPYGGLSATDEDTRYRLGGHIRANESMDIRLEGERRETADGDTEHGIFLTWKLQL